MRAWGSWDAATVSPRHILRWQRDKIIVSRDRASGPKEVGISLLLQNRSSFGGRKSEPCWIYGCQGRPYGKNNAAQKLSGEAVDEEIPARS
jgi:hypothetical protein